jgi:hypothetical protein
MPKANLLQSLLSPGAKDDVEQLYGPDEGDPAPKNWTT